MKPPPVYVRVTKRTHHVYHSGRGAKRVAVVYLPLGQVPMGRCWTLHSGNQFSNTWHRSEIAA